MIMTGHLATPPNVAARCPRGPSLEVQRMAVYPADPHVAAHLDDMALRGHTPATVYARSRALTRLQDFLQVPLLDATAADLMTWRRSLSTGPDATVAYVSNVRSFYAWAVRIGLLQSSPAAGLPSPKLSRRLPRPIPEDQLMAAVAGAPRRIRPWLVLAGWAGLRAREIAFLRREHVLEDGARPVLLVAADAAKGRRERIVPLSDFVRSELPLPAQGWLFRRADHAGGPNQPHLISHLANEYLHECGYSSTLHCLRHRFGTQTYQISHDLRVVQELLGHAYPNTTAGYAAFSAESAADAVAALAAPVGRI